MTKRTLSHSTLGEGGMSAVSRLRDFAAHSARLADQIAGVKVARVTAVAAAGAAHQLGHDAMRLAIDAAMSGPPVKGPGKRDAVIAAMPGTKAQIVRQAGVNASTVDDWIKELRASGQAHISGWVVASNNHWAAIFSAGRGVDVPKPESRPRKASAADVQNQHGTRMPIVAALFGPTGCRP